MRFAIEVREDQVPALIHQFVDIVGENALEKKFAWIAREHEDNPYMAGWLNEYHGLESTLAAVLESLIQSGQLPAGPTTREQYALYSFVAGVVRIYEGLSVRGRARLRGMLLDGLKSEKGLASVEHEVTTAIHLMRIGFDVEFQDLEQGGGVDFVAKKGTTELEVECKVFTADIGRQIHKRRLLSLYKTLMPVLERLHRDASTGILVRVVLPGRLTPSLQQAQGIVEAVSRAVLQGSGRTVSDACSVQTLDFAIDASPFTVPHPSKLSRPDVVDFVANRIGVRSLNPELAIIFTPARTAAVLLVESEVPDRVLEGMKYQLRHAAKGQFTGTRPGILTAHIHALSGAQMISLADLQETDLQNPTGLRVMTSNFLANDSRMHIHTVAYRARGELSLEQVSGSVTENGISYFIENPLNPVAGNEAYRIFSRSPPRE